MLVHALDKPSGREVWSFSYFCSAGRWTNWPPRTKVEIAPRLGRAENTSANFSSKKKFGFRKTKSSKPRPGKMSSSSQLGRGETNFFRRPVSPHASRAKVGGREVYFLLGWQVTGLQRISSPRPRLKVFFLSSPHLAGLKRACFINSKHEPPPPPFRLL